MAVIPLAELTAHVCGAHATLLAALYSAALAWVLGPHLLLHGHSPRLGFRGRGACAPEGALESRRFSSQRGLRARPSSKRPVAFDPMYGPADFSLVHNRCIAVPNLLCCFNLCPGDEAREAAGISLRSPVERLLGVLRTRAAYRAAARIWPGLKEKGYIEGQNVLPNIAGRETTTIDRPEEVTT